MNTIKSLTTMLETYKQVKLKTVVMMLGLLFMLSVSPVLAFAESESFVDVKSDYWAYKEITFLQEKGIAEAIIGDQYKPNEKVSRAKAARMLVKALNIDVTNVSETNYPDVAKSHPDYAYIAAATERGIFKGKDDGRFAPDESLTRSQMAKVLVNTFKLQGDYPTDFIDVTPGHWAFGFIDKLAASEVTTGYYDLSFKPSNKVTRAQMATFIYRAINGSFLKDYDEYAYSKDSAKVVNGIFQLKDWFGDSFYEPKSEINPYIHRQIYSITKSLLKARVGEDEDYISLYYAPKDDLFDSRVKIVYSPSSRGYYNSSFQWAFTFWENHKDGKEWNKSFSSKQVISLNIYTLTKGFAYEEWVPGMYAAQKKLDILQDNLISLFGQEDGKEIFNFIVQKHTELFLGPLDFGGYESKQIGNIQVDMHYNSPLHVWFSYVNE